MCVIFGFSFINFFFLKMYNLIIFKKIYFMYFAEYNIIIYLFYCFKALGVWMSFKR